MSGITEKERRQAGMVSILVTMLLMIVISLIVLGFAQISRRNQRQALDRQLSTQAFYAAETGVNDARNLINQAVTAGSSVLPKTDCTNGSGATAVFYSGLPNATLDATNKVSYSCLMVNPTPKDLKYGDITTTGKVVPIVASSGTISTIKFSWVSDDATNATPTTGCPASVVGAFSPTGSWTCGYGVLRFDLVPTSGSLTAAGLQSSTMTSFIVPFSSGGVSSIPYAASGANTNNRVGGACTNAGCNITITGLGGSQYYARITSIYKNAGSLDIVASDASGNALPLQDAQALVDATGKAQDVLRRIQVRIPLTPSSSNLLSDYALETTDAVCKRFVGMDTYFQSYAAAAVSGLTSITTPPNPFCQ